ncbi:MAG: DNA-binding protein [Endozoicomonas sp. (ex Botrylloides leachii)]|nr:DNA-binding protein [Endozoicomonas sp. (ex Botrylloides leachii)]
MESNKKPLSIQERVNKICNEIYAKGEKPSVRLVLAELPDVNSTSTVHKYFANWRSELEANQQSLYDRLGFSSEFTQSFMKEITRFGAEVEQRYKQLAKDANEQRDLAFADLARTEESLHQKEVIVEQHNKQVKTLQAELQMLKQQKETELDKARESNDAAIQEVRQQLATALEENKALSQHNETLRTAMTKSELKLEGNEELINEIKHQNKDLVDENKKLNQSITELSKNLVGKEAAIEGNEKLIISLQEQQQQIAQQLADEKERRQKLDEDLLALKTSVIDTQKKLEKEEIKVSEAQSKANELKYEIEQKSIERKETIRRLEHSVASYEKLIAHMENQKKTSDA